MIRIDLRENGPNKIEVKFYAPLDRKSEWNLRLYLFVPTSLRIRSFYTDRKKLLDRCYVVGRYSTPEFSILELLTLEVADNPMWFLRQFSITKELSYDEELAVNNNLRMLSNCFRYCFGHAVHVFKNLVSESVYKGSYLDAFSYAREFIRDSRAFTACFKGEMKRLTGSALLCPASVRNSFYCAEEVMTLHLANSLYEIYKVMLTIDSRYQDKEAVDETYSYLKHWLHLLNESRVEEGLSVEEKGYVRHKLKKWHQSILYLQPKVSKFNSRLSQIGASIAAAVAMSVALFFAIYTDRTFLDNTLPWIILTIIAYVCKDRIKEWLRIALDKVLPRFVYDRVDFFENPGTGKRICKNRVRAKLVESKTADPRIVRIRNTWTNPYLSFFPEEDVMLFELNLMIKGISRKERDKGSKQAKIAVISKFCLDDLFVNMDSSDDVIVNDFARSPDGVQKIAFHRDYHIHAILDAEKDGQSLPPAHYTIHLSKSGIDLIEEWKKKDNF